MQRLNEIINSIGEKPVTEYTKLYGRYERAGIVYNIRNVYGGQYKYCDVELEIPTADLLAEASCFTSEKTALSAYIMREFALCTHLANNEMQQQESNVQKGFFIVYKFGQRVLENNAVSVNDDVITISMTVKLPFNTEAYKEKKQKKGIISAKALKLLLTKNLPSFVQGFIENFDREGLAEAVLLYRRQRFIRGYMKKNGVVSFVANGSLLPRKGKTEFKDLQFTVPFASPPSMEITIPFPDGGEISGMAIPCGVTVITGDAYHGKSTILDAIREGVWDHVAGDGREYVLTDESALAVEAEDGRYICNVDISFFLRDLPVKSLRPESFSTENASGSTSQAAAVAEAIESGCRLMLFDEDKSANNFMYKDNKMRSVINNPSTRPFIDSVRGLFRNHGVSSIIVVGASGEYFKAADRVIAVESFAVSEYTDFETVENSVPHIDFTNRTVDLSKLRRVCLLRDISVKDDATVKIGGELVNVAEIIPNPTRGQIEFICCLLYCLTVFGTERGDIPLADRMKTVYRKIDHEGIGSLCRDSFGKSADLEYVRPYDIMRILYRLRSVGFKCKKRTRE